MFLMMLSCRRPSPFRLGLLNRVMRRQYGKCHLFVCTNVVLMLSSCSVNLVFVFIRSRLNKSADADFFLASVLMSPLWNYKRFTSWSRGCNVYPHCSLQTRPFSAGVVRSIRTCEWRRIGSFVWRAASCGKRDASTPKGYHLKISFFSFFALVFLVHPC